MKIFIIFGILIVATTILPTTVGANVPVKSGPVCNCACPKPQIPDNQFYTTDRLRRCPECPPTTCVCPTCSPTPITVNTNPLGSPKLVAKVIDVSAKKPINCDCPKCPPIIHPEKKYGYWCICPKLACSCEKCVENMQ